MEKPPKGATNPDKGGEKQIKGHGGKQPKGPGKQTKVKGPGKQTKGPGKQTKIKVFNKKKKRNQPEDVVIEKLRSQYSTIDSKNATKFTDFPISSKTIKGLRESKYTTLTDIQKASIPLALQGKDILGAAQTGSGKTLAFLIPIMESLYCEQWSRVDGVGALVITPTRELAYQIFETLRKVGKYHDFSAGLIIGGKDLKFERKRMDQCNVIVCTPGRLLQHMDENPLFDCVTMKILVLDEADRCLDMGFRDTMNAIVANLPSERQTLLFSATQTKSVQDLARLSLKDPSYVSVNEMTTPKELQQSYVICNLEDKLSIIWSFIRNHLKQKTIIFFSTCKQVKYFYELFCKLRPGLSLLPLYGTLHQLRRMKIYEEFSRKQSAVLFATDLAARGLDFPEVHWVVQADCPEDVQTYIHRVGRTARYHKGGESWLLVLPSETKILEHLEEKKIPITKIDVNPAKVQNPIRKIEAFLARDTTLKDTAQRAVGHYAKAIHLMKQKDVFDVRSLDLDAFSKSIGLAVPPRIRFLDRMNRKPNGLKNVKEELHTEAYSAKNDINANLESLNTKKYFNDSEAESSNEAVKLETVQALKVKKESEEEEEDSDSYAVEINNRSKDNLSKKSNIKEDTQKKTKTQEYAKKMSNFAVENSEDDEDDQGDVFQIKRRDHDIALPANVGTLDLSIMGRSKNKKPITKAAIVKKMLKKNIVANKKTIFDDEGASAIVHGSKEKQSELAREYENEDLAGIDIERAKLVLREEDKFDKQVFKAKVKAKHKEEKRKLKELKKLERGEQDEQDEFGESEDEGPDLSWLPDPDKIYGDKTYDDIDIGNSDDEDSNDDTIASQPKNIERAKKRKSKGPDNLETVLKRKKKQRTEQLCNDLNVNETEELALMLLKGRK